MVLALDLLILFLFSIHILSISQTAENVREGRERIWRALTETLKPVCLCTL